MTASPANQAPDQELGTKTFLGGIRAAGNVSCRAFGTPRELLADDLAVLLSESFQHAATGGGAPGMSPARPGTSPETGSPAGTVTFACTGIEGSARLWETEPGAMARSVALHDHTLPTAFEHHGGVVVSR